MRRSRSGPLALEAVDFRPLPRIGSSGTPLKPSKRQNYEWVPEDPRQLVVVAGELLDAALELLDTAGKVLLRGAHLRTVASHGGRAGGGSSSTTSASSTRSAIPRRSSASARFSKPRWSTTTPAR